jgi:DNA-binding transcriptional LysR family regulator
MDMQKLKYFIAVVEYGTVSKAAEALNMTQPPLSMLLKKFEEEIGIQLFKRVGRRLHLTEPGHILYQRGVELLASSESILQEAREYQQDKRGNVFIGSATVANLTIIPEVVKRMNESGYHISVHVKEGSTPYILEHLRFHKLDIGIVRNVYNRDDLMTTKLFSEPLMVALPPNHALAGRKTVTLEELKNENFLLYHSSYEFNVSEIIVDECRKRGFSPNVIYWGTETMPILGMVNNGLGVAFPPKSILKMAGITLPPLAELTDPVIKTTMNMVTMKNNIKKDVVDHFLHMAQEVIGEMEEQCLFS